MGAVVGGRRRRLRFGLVKGPAGEAGEETVGMFSGDMAEPHQGLFGVRVATSIPSTPPLHRAEATQSLEREVGFQASRPLVP